MMHDARDDLVPDPLAYEDFIAMKHSVVDRVRSRLAAGYEPSSLLRMDVPKSELAFRPGSVPLIEDRLAYTALVGSFAAKLDEALEAEDVVPSHRVLTGRKKSLFKFGVRQWFKFQDLVRDGYCEGGYRYLLVTDLTAFFDHIDHDILISQLRSVGVRETSLALLRTMLKHWSGGKSIGIPQGLDPSSLLGNFYLDPLDKSMVRSGYSYMRYVDDIRVFASSRSELKRAMLHVVRLTRDLGLHVQTGKTKIYEGSTILDIVNARQAEIAAIDYHLDYGEDDLAIDRVEHVLRDLLTADTFNDRHFRKCLNSLKKVRSPLGVKYTLRKLPELEPWAQSAAEYLEPFVRSHPSIKRRLMEYLMDRDRNVFETPEFWFAWTLKNATRLPREFLDWCRDRVQDRDCHWNCRAQYALLLGIHGDLADKLLVRSLVPSRENDYERRAFLVALKSLPEPEKGTAISGFRTDYPHLEPAIALAA